jgi:ankyrin repeat protein
LLAAVQDRNLTAVQEALANGAELNIQDNNGRTSLIIGKNFII